MTQSNTNSNHSNPQSIGSATPDRCRYFSPAGRRCRIPAGSSGLCAKHQADQAAEVAAALTVGLDDFSSAEQINTFLARLLLLASQDKISARRAAVLTYIASQLLHSILTLIKEEKDKPTEIIFDAPRPPRNGPDRSGEPHPQDTSNTPTSLELVRR